MEHVWQGLARGIVYDIEDDHAWVRALQERGLEPAVAKISQTWMVSYAATKAKLYGGGDIIHDDQQMRFVKTLGEMEAAGYQFTRTPYWRIRDITPPHIDARHFEISARFFFGPLREDGSI